MFDFDLNISKKSNDEKVILQIPIYFYLIFSFIGIFIFLSIIFYGASTLSYIFLFISVVALTYKEIWIFNKEEDKSFHKTGLGFVYKKINFNLKDIELLEQTTFIKGQDSISEKKSKFSFINKRYYSMKLHLNTGQVFTLITVLENKKDKLDIIINEIQSISGVKIEK